MNRITRALKNQSFLSLIKRLINRIINRRIISEKVFCIGLHKTGTTTLAHLFGQYGFLTNHSIDWINDEKALSSYDFFSDGGSHFDDINEFDFERLANAYPKAKFILQTRDTRKWIVSKLKHASWDENTPIEKDDSQKIKHDDWTYKSLLTITKFIEHKINYEKKVEDYFENNFPDRLIVIDITNRDTQNQEFERLKTFTKLKSLYRINLPHSNPVKSKTSIPLAAKEHIDVVLSGTSVNEKG